MPRKSGPLIWPAAKPISAPPAIGAAPNREFGKSQASALPYPSISNAARRATEFVGAFTHCGSHDAGDFECFGGFGQPRPVVSLSTAAAAPSVSLLPCTQSPNGRPAYVIQARVVARCRRSA